MVIQRYCSSSSTTSFSFSLENFLAKGFETFQEKNIFQILKLKTIFLLDFFHQNIHSEFLPEPNIYNSYIYIYMLRIAGNTAGPIGLKFCVGTHGLGVLKVKKKFGKKNSAQSVQVFFGQL